MARIALIVLLAMLVTAVPQPGMAAPSPYRAAVAVGFGSGYGALTAPDEVTAILLATTPTVTTAPLTVSFPVAARADGANYRATGRIACWSTLAIRQDGRWQTFTAQVRVKLAQPVSEMIAAPVAWGTAAGALTLIADGEPYQVTTGGRWPSANRLPVEGYNVQVIDLLGVPRDGAARGPVFDAAGRLVGVAVGAFVSTGAEVRAGGLLQIGNPSFCGAVPQAPPPASQSAVPVRRPTVAVRPRTTEQLTVRVSEILTQRLRACGAVIRSADADADLSLSVRAQWFPIEGLLRLEAAVTRRDLAAGYVVTDLSRHVPAASVSDDDLLAAFSKFAAHQELTTLCAPK